MDSIDWFSPTGIKAGLQVAATNRALKLGGRVLLRSAGLRLWYIQEFEVWGFTTQRISLRLAGSCIDRYILSFSNFFCCSQGSADIKPSRVNMYASTWLCVKTEDLLAPHITTPTTRDPPAASISPVPDTTRESTHPSIVERLEL